MTPDDFRLGLTESIDTLARMRDDATLLDALDALAGHCVQTLQRDGRVLFAGNGGSAADAQHLAAEFSGRFYTDRNPLPSEALHCNTSYLTAVANDYGYDVVYSRMIKGMGRQGDVLISLSTSGNSVNILKAMEVARELGMVNVALTGETGGKMKDWSDYLINVPSTDTPRIQESHIMVGHIICQLVEEALF